MLIRTEQEIDDDELRVEVNLRGGQTIALTWPVDAVDSLRQMVTSAWNGSTTAARAIALGGNTIARADAIDSITTYTAETWNARVRASNQSWMRNA